MHYFTGSSPRVNEVEIQMILLLSPTIQLYKYPESNTNSPLSWRKTNKILSFTLSYLNCPNITPPVHFYFSTEGSTRNLNSPSFLL